jgi:hypothetical protein
MGFSLLPLRHLLRPLLVGAKKTLDVSCLQGQAMPFSHRLLFGESREAE